MDISFKNDINIIGIGVGPWARLGPEKWFKNYEIASYYGWDVADIENAPKNTFLYKPSAGTILSDLKTDNLLANNNFQSILLQAPQDTIYMPYKAVNVPNQLSDRQFLIGDKQLAGRLENKVEFRSLMSSKGIPFPKFKVYRYSELISMSPDELLGGVMPLVVQDESLSGGKGTYIVKDQETLDHALSSLKTMSGGERVVVSEFIVEAHERSVQACVTQYGVFIGPLQKQIIADPTLANLTIPDADRFCGAEITPNDTYAGAYEEIKKYTMLIGEEIKSQGYKGIFSVDCLVNDQGQVYVLEINPRITGITPLLTMLYRGQGDIPFYLLHILELADLPYTINDVSLDPAPLKGSLMLLYAHANEEAEVKKTLPSGEYNQDLDLYRRNFKFTNDEISSKILIHQFTPENIEVKPGYKLLDIYAKHEILDQNDTLSAETQGLIKKLYGNITLEPHHA